MSAKPNFCKIPKVIKGKEGDLYKNLLSLHCSSPDKKEGNHKCIGCISISRNSITFKCKKCGDSRGLLE